MTCPGLHDQEQNQSPLVEETDVDDDRFWREEGRRGGADLGREAGCPMSGPGRAGGRGKGDTGSQRPGGQEGLTGTLKPVVTLWTGCLEGQESADQGQAERLSKGTEGPAGSGDMNLCQ